MFMCLFSLPIFLLTVGFFAYSGSFLLAIRLGAQDALSRTRKSPTTRRGYLLRYAPAPDERGGQTLDWQDREIYIYIYGNALAKWTYFCLKISKKAQKNSIFSNGRNLTPKFLPNLFFE